MPLGIGSLLISIYLERIELTGNNPCGYYLYRYIYYIYIFQNFSDPTLDYGKPRREYCREQPHRNRGANPGYPALNGLDPNVQAQLFDRISREIRDQVRATLAAIPAVNFQAGGINPAAPLSAGHSAGSSLDSCVNGQKPIGDMDVNFNWGSSLLTPTTADQNVSTLSLTPKHCVLNFVSALANKASKKPHKRPRIPSPNRDETSPILNGLFTPKRRKIAVNTSIDKKYKQTSLTSFFRNDTQREILDQNDQNNVAHLVALEAESTLVDHDSQASVTSPHDYHKSHEPRDNLPSEDRVRRAKQKEPMLS